MSDTAMAPMVLFKVATGVACPSTHASACQGTLVCRYLEREICQVPLVAQMG